MENNSFKKLFLRNFGLLPLLILGCTAFVTDFSSEEEYQNFKILITSSGGLQFSKEESPEGKKIIYDCQLGVKDKGYIKVFDDIHPDDMKSLIIKNCFEVTLYGPKCDSNERNFFNFKELKISNVTSLRLSCDRSYYSYPNLGGIKVSISDVEHLDVDTFQYFRLSRLSLKLQNVVIDTLEKLFEGYEENDVFNLHLKNVKINKIAERAFELKNSDLILTVENSDFKYVGRKAFLLKGTAVIINNTFNFLDEAAFSVNTSSSFTFSGNRVKRMLNPFYISSSEVNIINNTFDSIVKPWLPKINGSEIKSFNVLNITGNIIHHWSQNMFYMEPQNFPNIFIFEGNYLNCSCKNAITLGYKIQDYIAEVFLNKEQKNFCHNLGNCPLHKALRKGSGICLGTFQCPEDDQKEDDENAHMWPSHVKSILSVLKNIDIKLDQISQSIISS